MTQLQSIASTKTKNSNAAAWLRALELTSSIATNRSRIFPSLIEELAARWGEAPALLSDRESLTYSGLFERANRYSRWALAQGLAKGETVCLLMPNRPEYMAVWVGITQIGGLVALINTNQTGPSLRHSIDIVSAKHIIVAAEFVDTLQAALSDVQSQAAIWVHGASDHASPNRIDREIEQYPCAALNEAERRPMSVEDLALYIYTSGTTGLPKAVNVSHARLLQWALWFAGMMNTQPADRMYDCLPMYHSVGGVLAPGAVLAGGGSVVLRERFSASQFWSDVVRWDCTLVQYIGELCRYLIQTPPCEHDKSHRVRMACGNGLRPDVWEEFRDRFHIPQIFEFYAATEGGVSLFNIEGECGAIGRVPSYLAHRFSPVLVKFDVAKEEPLRNEEGFCIRCGVNEPGEAIGRVSDDPANAGTRFEGYTNEQASEKRRLRDVFKRGDVWNRTGDLMRQDERGFFHFVDRIGDTFRWKGENVATLEVSEAIVEFPGVANAIVYGVEIPGTDGRAGMAALTTGHDFDLPAFRAHLVRRLPSYARPLFLRIRNEIELTGTFKPAKADLVRAGYAPAEIDETLYFNHPEREAFVRMDPALYERIRGGHIRL